MALIDAYDALLLDLDGTVWAGGTALPHAVEAINAAGVPAMYVTNNASRSASDVAAMLRAIGLHAGDTSVLTSAMAALGLAETHLDAGDRVLVLGAPSFKSLVADTGFEVVSSADEEPKVVLQGHSPETGWRELSEAALAIRAGAKYLVSNLDTSLPSERGLMVGNGSMVAAVVSATGATPISAGKPEPAMFHQAADTVGAQRPLAVGDRLDTDIAGAVAAGIPVLHVLTGVSGPRALIEAPASQRPTFIADDMTGLAADSDALRPGAQAGFTARVDGDRVVLEGGSADGSGTGAGTAALRTVLAVAWDMPQPPREVAPGSDSAEAAIDAWW